MILSTDAPTTVSLTRSLCHTVQGLNRHEKGGKKDNKAYTKGNVGVALEFLHEVEQTNLPHQCGKETNSEANHGVVRNEQTEYNKGSRCSEAGKENHACRRRRRHLGMNSHCKHKRTLDYATSNSKHTSEESSQTTDERIDNSCTAVPLDITLNVLVANSLLPFPTLHEVLSHENGNDKDPTKHNDIGYPKRGRSTLNSNRRFEGTAALHQVDE
mmetsp:Transcript_5680/g.11991  ORF Transcript_5680/g.11991 Transcript_5680/m.11991 type:complete len:214 (+) Transcript_5680:142-783(+)